MSARENASRIFLNLMITNLRNIYQGLLESRGEENTLDFISSKLEQLVYYCHIGNNLYQLQDISCLLIDSLHLIQETRKEYREQVHGFEFK